MSEPQVLDIGCGEGQPTVELARLTDGTVTGIDIDAASLEFLEQRAEEAGVADRVNTVKGSYMEMDFPEGHFDLIWAEATLHVVGLEDGIREVSRFIRPGGHFVIHEMVLFDSDYPEEMDDAWDGFIAGMPTPEDLIEICAKYGLEEVGHFLLEEKAWETMYFEPLDRRVEGLREKYSDDPESLALLEEEEQNNEVFRRYQKWWRSGYFVLRKR